MGAFSAPPAADGRIWAVDCYVRASREDGGTAQSETITNQIAMLTDFIRSQPDLRLHQIRRDDGVSGVTFDRPGFNAMLEDIKSGAADCVLVKDLSRLGRDYIEAGRYIEDIFPFLGVRFIALQDGYDSQAERSASDGMVLPFKNLLNDSYARDISIKVRSSKESKRRRGEFIGPFPAYGYLKSPENKNRLAVDQGAAETVREIYRCYLTGMSPQAVAQKLNDEGVLSPLEYKRAAGLNFTTTFQVNPTAKWTAVAVRRILTNELYIGTLVQGRESTPNHKVKARRRRPEDQWARVENAHEPIISKDLFVRVQVLLGRDTRTAPEEDGVYPLAGLIACGDCGAPMVRRPLRSGGREYVYYICSAYKHQRECSRHGVREDRLAQGVLAAVQVQIDGTVDLDGLFQCLDRLSPGRREAARLSAVLTQKEEELERYRTLKSSLYESLTDGLLTREEYILLKEGYTRRCEEAEEAAARLRAEIQEAAQAGGPGQWVESFRQNRKLTELTRTAAAILVEEVKVYEGQRVELRFRHKSQYALLRRRREDGGGEGD